MNDDSYIYSISGRNAGEKYDIKTKINKMKGIKKIKFVRDFYTPDPEWNNNSDNNIDFIDLFQENKKDKEFKNENNSIENKIIKLLKNNLYNDEDENNKDIKNNKNNKNNIDNKDNLKTKFSKINKNENGKNKINNKNKNHINNNNLKNENSKINIENNNDNKDIKNKNKVKNFYDDFIKTLKVNDNKKVNLKLLKKKNLKRTKSACDIDRYKYHKLHIAKLAKYKKIGLLQKINKVQNAIYTPKFDYIYKRIITGPKWKQLTGRNQTMKIDNRSCSNFVRNYLKDSYFKEGKGFISMAKQTQRNGFPISNNLRERYEKKFTPLNNKLNTKKDAILIKKNISFNINDNKNSNNNSKNLIKKRIKLNLNKNKKLKEYKSVPDFNRYLSRDQTNKKITNVYNGNNLLYPNYNYIEEKVKMMVLYNNKKNIPNKNEFEGIHQNEFYDANKIFKILKGNKSSALKFDKMTSRPYDKVLPVFMKGIHSRFVSSEVTDKTLEMNNYANINFFDFNNTYNKKSFNKYVNLCLLKSDYIQPENIQNKSEFIVLSRKVNDLKLNKNNIEQLLENVKMNEFDKITMKSVKYNHNKKHCNY